MAKADLLLEVLVVALNGSMRQRIVAMSSKSQNEVVMARFENQYSVSSCGRG
jgi:hypothetical protein